MQAVSCTNVKSTNQYQDTTHSAKYLSGQFNKEPNLIGGGLVTNAMAAIPKADRIFRYPDGGGHEKIRNQPVHTGQHVQIRHSGSGPQESGEKTVYGSNLY